MAKFYCSYSFFFFKSLTVSYYSVETCEATVVGLVLKLFSLPLLPFMFFPARSSSSLSPKWAIYCTSSKLALKLNPYFILIDFNSSISSKAYSYIFLYFKLSLSYTSMWFCDFISLLFFSTCFSSSDICFSIDIFS